MATLPLEQFSSSPSTFPALNASSASSSQSQVVVLGASAGGLNAISIILASLLADFSAPIVIVQHLSPDFPSQMARILSGLTSLRVKQAEEGDCLQAGHVYIAPPGKHLLINLDLSLSLSVSAKVHHCRPSVDVLFRSAAASCGSRTIGVVLTGSDGDGTASIQAIKAAGGTTFAQDEQSSEDFSMPRHAAETGDVDFVLPLSEIAAALMDLAGSSDLVSSDKAAGSDKAAMPNGSKKSEKELMMQAELDFCCEALRVAEEALRVQDDVIASYRGPSSTITP